MLNIWIYTVWLLASGLYCLVALPFLLLVLPWLNATRRRHLIRYIILYYGQWVITLTGWPFIRVKYIDRAPAEQEPGIFVCNHRSASDPFLVAKIDRNLVQTVNYWPLQLPLLGFFARQGEYLNINGEPFELLAAKSRNLLHHGVTIVSFPEGTRSGSKNMGQFHSGIFKIALELQCPLYPLCIVGNEAIPDRKFKFHPGQIRVEKLPMLRYSDYKDMSAFKLKNYLREQLQQATAKIDEELC